MSDQFSMINALTVDVEDYFHVNAFSDQICRSDWDHFESRVVANTERMLRLFDGHGVRGTFFILGWVAERFPGLVKSIQTAGHEIGNHSYWHRLIYTQTPEEFRDDLKRCSAVLEDITGEPVRAYRAPSFSITKQSQWALEILAEEGFQFDSSIFPIHHDRYGIPGAEPHPHAIETSESILWEFPPSIRRFGKLNLPIAGGGYFRLYPYWFSRRMLSAVNTNDKQPFMFYIHPWEIDPDQPRLKGTWKSRFRHYQNLRTTHRKLDKLLQAFPFGTLTTSLRDLSIPAGNSTSDHADTQTADSLSQV